MLHPAVLTVDTDPPDSRRTSYHGGMCKNVNFSSYPPHLVFDAKDLFRVWLMTAYPTHVAFVGKPSLRRTSGDRGCDVDPLIRNRKVSNMGLIRLWNYARVFFFTMTAQSG